MKNVIVMISDGWGYNQMLAGDYYSTGHRVETYQSSPAPA